MKNLKHPHYKKKPNKSIINLTNNYKVHVANNSRAQEEVDVILTIANLLGYNLTTESIYYSVKYKTRKRKITYKLSMRTKEKSINLYFYANKNNNTMSFCKLIIFYSPLNHPSIIAQDRYVRNKSLVELFTIIKEEL